MYDSSLEFQAGRGKGCGYWEYHKIDDLGFKIFKPHLVSRPKPIFTRPSTSDDDKEEDLKRRRLYESGNIEDDSLSNPDIAILAELKPPRRARKIRKKNFKPTDKGGDDYGPTSIHCDCDINDLSKCLQWHGYCPTDATK